MFKHVLVTGGAGYVGSLLTPQLHAAGYRVTVYDTLYFGDGFLPKHNPGLTVIKGDLRNTPKLAEAMQGADAVIGLGCISNDASFELDEKLSTSVNLEAFEPMVLAAKKAGVRRFIYASSSSVYGVSESPDVTEDHPLVPLTLYNKYKGMCEPLLFKHQSPEFVCVFSQATQAEVFDRIRSTHISAEALAWIYVMNASKRLVGAVALVDLLRADASERVGDVAEASQTVRVDADVEEIARLITDFDLTVVPVVDDEQRILGVVTVDDVLELVLPRGWRRQFGLFGE